MITSHQPLVMLLLPKLGATHVLPLLWGQAWTPLPLAGHRDLQRAGGASPLGLQDPSPRLPKVRALQVQKHIHRCWLIVTLLPPLATPHHYRRVGRQHCLHHQQQARCHGQLVFPSAWPHRCWSRLLAWISWFQQ